MYLVVSVHMIFVVCVYVSWAVSVCMFLVFCVLIISSSYVNVLCC